VAGPENVLAVLRTAGDDQVLCVINLDGQAEEFNHDSLASARLLDTGLKAEHKGKRLSLPPYGAAYLSLG
jgi:hypothetical protein